ncbi:hypothetical protein [Piscirickettsia litoralis]|uniref:Fungal lipase-like domain-containing protein n=1 Tax=Piscirickettsia litoralis TaxID=1891921 RepID=A0ABX3ACI0_9GAMM|nr:hypothetical protein [Piscirickettsia litoralis]ODN43874.1 hypothetical protein BGC07_14480 [Piscirickettsia litoralis]
MAGHSRGCISANKAVQLIQSDPDLNSKVKVVLDEKDPVPGNLRLTSAIGSSAVGTITHKAKDLRKCSVVEKAYITLSTASAYDLYSKNNKIGHDALIPELHPDTESEVEIIPGHHLFCSDIGQLGFCSSRSKMRHLMFLELKELGADSLDNDIKLSKDDEIRQYNNLMKKI